SCFVALARTAEWFLWAPAGRPQQVTDVIEVIVHAELASDDLGDAPRSPDLATKAERLGTQCQQQAAIGRVAPASVWTLDRAAAAAEAGRRHCPPRAHAAPTG